MSLNFFSCSLPDTWFKPPPDTTLRSNHEQSYLLVPTLNSQPFHKHTPKAAKDLFEILPLLKISNGYPSHLHNAQVITMPYDGIISLNLPQEIFKIYSFYLDFSSLRSSHVWFFLIILKSGLLLSQIGLPFALISILRYDFLSYLVLFLFS